VTTSPFIRDLIRKSEQSLRSSRELQDHDFDGSVNRSYYAMFNTARAALLSIGVPERDLPRTHSGVIAAFSQHAVHSGRIDPELAAAFGRTEALRLQADYANTGMDQKTAADTLARAEIFVATVARVFALHEPSRTMGLEDGHPSDGDKVSEPGDSVERIETPYTHAQPLSLEEERRKARENWLRLRQQKIAGASDIGHERDTDHRRKDDLSHCEEPGDET
jgi:uncharacterized protein (UPF0332 family)